jgi:hypothetical protein
MCDKYDSEEMAAMVDRSDMSDKSEVGDIAEGAFGKSASDPTHGRYEALALPDPEPRVSEHAATKHDERSSTSCPSWTICVI